MQLYIYLPESGEYAGACLADPDPLTPGEFLHPAFSTPEPPPPLAEKQAAIFADGAWSVVADHRGETWFDENRNPVVVTALGVPDGLTAECPDAPPPTADQLKAYAAAKRYAVEVGGIISPTYGPLDTDRDTRSIIGQTIQSLDLGLVSPPIRFKSGGSFVSLDRTAFVAISTEIAAHVQLTFELEDRIDSEIDAGTVTTFDEIDTFF